MAEEPEQRMLFDLRGRRKRVIQVIYVLLALIMVASLVVIGLPGGMNPFNSGTTINEDGAKLSVERAERLQERIAANPDNLNAQQELIRARIAAGNNLIELDDSGNQQVTEEATAQYDLAAQAWEEYVQGSNKQPDQAVAQLVANMLFTLSQGSTVAQFESNISDAARAQNFVAQQAEQAAAKGDAPSPLGPLTTLATYEFYAQNFKAAQDAKRRALAEASGSERNQIQRQLNAVERDAKRIGKQIAAAKKQAKQDGGKSLQQPAGNLGSSDTLGGGGLAP